MSSDTVSHHRQLRRPAYQGSVRPASPAIVFFKVVTAVEALTPPALLSGRDQAWSGGALAFDAAGGRP